MKIGIVQKKIGWSGQSSQVWELACGLRARGHDVVLIAQPGSAFSERARAGGFVLHEIKMKGSAQIGAVFKMARIVRSHRIDVLHCHDSRDHQICVIAGRLGGVRALVRTKHNLLPLRNGFSRLVYGRLTSKLISVSDAVKRVLVACGIPDRKVHTVYNYVDTEKYKPGAPDPALKKSLGLLDGAPVVGTVGRLHQSKGIAEMIEAMPRVKEVLPRVKFLLVGSRYEQWKPMVGALGVGPQVIFTGTVPNVEDYLALMDVAVFPTHREAFGLAVLEAMAAGRAVVASRVGGLPEVVDHEVDGLLVEPRDPGALADAVLRLLSNDALRGELAAAAGRKAGTKFTRDECIAGTEKVYELAISH